MDVFIARQPIFDREMHTYGYELYFRNSNQNEFAQIDDDMATAEVLYDSFFVIGIDDLTDGTKAFINFSKALIDSDVPLLLPKQRIVVEILERGKATDYTAEACERIREMGYQLALDDFVFDSDNLPLLNSADIVKVEFPSLSIDKQAALLRLHHGKALFLAEKIETREDFSKACELGYDLFQGYFFSKPAMVKSKDIQSFNASLFRIIEELNKHDPSFPKISEIIETDLGLSYKLLKLVNSVYIGPKYKVKSIPQALTFLGTRELYQWISLMLLKDLKNVENAELIKQSLIRGKLMSVIAKELDLQEKASDYFFTGLFSLIDVILCRPMEELVAGLPLTDEVKEALNGGYNDLSELLNCISYYEQAQWDRIRNSVLFNVIGANKFMSLYVNALQWAKNLEH